MRNFINILNEATKVATRDDLASSLMPFHAADQDVTVAAPTSMTPVDHETTARAVTNANIQFPHGALAGLSSIEGRDIVSDEEARAGRTTYLEPRTPETLPALISNAVARTDGDFEPEWHQIRNLPGYMMNSIRMIGREVFTKFTTAAIEDIQMMCTILNPEADVMKMMAWIKKHGHKEDEMTFDFGHIIPNFIALFQMWRVEGFEFGLCHDMGGYYIYGWPENNRQVTNISDLEDDEPRRLN